MSRFSTEKDIGKEEYFGLGSGSNAGRPFGCFTPFGNFAGLPSCRAVTSESTLSRLISLFGFFADFKETQTKGGFCPGADNLTNAEQPTSGFVDLFEIVLSDARPAVPELAPSRAPGVSDQSVVVVRYCLDGTTAGEGWDSFSRPVLVYEHDQALADELQELIWGRGKAEGKLDWCTEANLEVIVHRRGYLGDLGYPEMVRVNHTAVEDYLVGEFAGGPLHFESVFPQVASFAKAVGAELLEGQDEMRDVLHRSTEKQGSHLNPSLLSKGDPFAEEGRNEHDRPRWGSLAAFGLGALVGLVVQAVFGQLAGPALLHRPVTHRASQMLPKATPHGGAEPSW